MIQLNHVTYTYPNQTAPALADFSALIQPGEFVLVVGPSGAGKSTFLRSLNGLVPHFYGGRWSGRAEVFGRDPVALAPAVWPTWWASSSRIPRRSLWWTRWRMSWRLPWRTLRWRRPPMRKRVEEVLDQIGHRAPAQPAHQHPLGRREAARGARLGAGVAARGAGVG